MAHERFRTRSARRRRSGLVLPLVSFVLLLGVFFWGLSGVSASTAAQQRQSLEDAVRRSATHCYATEGAYPASLSYLEEHYGLRWDKDRYRVEYTVFASNLSPEIRVTRLS